jgi:Chitobiase/beta-hexosaminidase C-terminal domain
VAPNYSNSMDYGNSILKLDLTNGVPTMSAGGKTVGDEFTPFNQASLNNGDLDQGSGGTLLLPTAASGGQHLLVQAGKTGRIYVVNQESMGGYHPSNTSDPQQKGKVAGMWSAPAYWNGHLYFWASGDNLRAFSFVNGVMSSAPTSVSPEFSNFPGSTPTVSANGNSNGIVWDILSQNFASRGRATLLAHDALNVSKLLYSSEQNLARDNPGAAVKFTVPTVVNGKVYVGTESQLSVYGLLNGMTQAAAPAISPASESFTSSVTVTMTDSTPGASIHYTTNGTTPTAASPAYSGPITVTVTETIHAVAVATGYLDSNISSATYTKSTQAVMPTFSPAPGTYSAAQQVTIKSTTAGATIYYTTNGTTPTTASTKYTGPVAISSTTTLKAIATAPGLTNSAVASGLYTIQSGTTTVATPTFSPAPGQYPSAFYLSMSTRTVGATIYYTMNGTTPTTLSPKYVGALVIHGTTTVKAIAVAPNMTNSAIATGGAERSGDRASPSARHSATARTRPYLPFRSVPPFNTSPLALIASHASFPHRGMG